MKVFVVGATGALGRRLLPMLLTAGHEVTAAGRPSPRLAALARPGVDVATLDIFDSAAAGRAMHGHDAVINVATHVPPGMRALLPRSWREMDRIRNEASFALVNGALAAGVGRFIQESFAPIYDDGGDRWLDERAPVRPGRYNSSVLAAETVNRLFADTGHVGVILRFAFLYGPGDPFTAQMLDTVRHGWMPFFGRPEAYLALVTQHDAAAAAVAALGAPSGIYNVVDDEPLTRDEFARVTAKLLGTRTPRFAPAWATRLGSVAETLGRSLRLSNRKLKAASTWAPEFASAREGMRASV
jgi:nucleoside-diphosphate-sugar epimerase